jgi:hypothetical protein
VGEGEVEIGERCRWRKPEHQRRLVVTGTGTGTGTTGRIGGVCGPQISLQGRVCAAAVTMN